MERARTPRTTLSILFIDLKFFKKVIDSLGHMVGDEVLRNVARCLEKRIRFERDYAVRWGGDEFLLILPACEKDDAERIGDKIRQEDWNMIGKGTTGFGASIGVASWNFESSLDEFLDEADKAMYREKEQKVR